MTPWEVNLSAWASRWPEALPDSLLYCLRAAGPWPGPWVRAKDGSFLPPVPAAPTVSLVSVYDLEREASRWVGDTPTAGGVVVLGGTSPSAIRGLLRKTGALVVQVEPRLEVWRSILTCWDWSDLIGDPSWHVPESPKELQKFLEASYFPLWDGRFVVKEWRTALEYGAGAFEIWKSALDKTFSSWSTDLSTQTRLGRRWTRNTLINLARLRPFRLEWERWHTAVVLGAGPGLEEALRDKENQKLLIGRPSNGVRVLASDTSLPVLLAEGLLPDLVVSLDGQLASYHHFVSGLPKEIPVLADLAALPLLGRLSKSVLRFRTSHPLASYSTRDYPEVPFLDASLGQVAGVAIVAAEALGARRAFLWGMDFAYPMGKAYARGTYVYPYFQRISDRLRPSDSLLTAFAFRTAIVERFQGRSGPCYTNAVLRSYRDSLEAAAHGWNLKCEVWQGPGLPLNLLSSYFEKKTSPAVWSNPDADNRWPIFRERLRDLWTRIKIPRTDLSFREFNANLDAETRKAWLALWPLAAWQKMQSVPQKNSDWSVLAEETVSTGLKILAEI